jgi:hypothetical protein
MYDELFELFVELRAAMRFVFAAGDGLCGECGHRARVCVRPFRPSSSIILLQWINE